MLCGPRKLNVSMNGLDCNDSGSFNGYDCKVYNMYEEKIRCEHYTLGLPIMLVIHIS